MKIKEQGLERVNSVTICYVILCAHLFLEYLTVGFDGRGEKGYTVQNMGIQKDPEITQASGLVRAEVTSSRSCLVQLFYSTAWCQRARRHNSSCMNSVKLLVSFMPQFTAM